MANMKRRPNSVGHLQLNFWIINGQTFTQITDILDKDLVTVV